MPYVLQDQALLDLGFRTETIGTLIPPKYHQHLTTPDTSYQDVETELSQSIATITELKSAGFTIPNISSILDQSYRIKSSAISDMLKIVLEKINIFTTLKEDCNFVHNNFATILNGASTPNNLKMILDKLHANTANIVTLINAGLQPQSISAILTHKHLQNTMDKLIAHTDVIQELVRSIPNQGAVSTIIQKAIATIDGCKDMSAELEAIIGSFHARQDISDSDFTYFEKSHVTNIFDHYKSLPRSIPELIPFSDTVILKLFFTEKKWTVDNTFQYALNHRKTDSVKIKTMTPTEQELVKQYLTNLHEQYERDKAQTHGPVVGSNVGAAPADATEEEEEPTLQRQRSTASNVSATLKHSRDDNSDDDLPSAKQTRSDPIFDVMTAIKCMIEERDTLLDIEDNIARQFGDQYVQLATGLMKAHIINSSDTHSLFDIDFDM